MRKAVAHRYESLRFLRVTAIAFALALVFLGAIAIWNRISSKTDSLAVMARARNGAFQPAQAADTTTISPPVQPKLIVNAGSENANPYTAPGAEPAGHRLLIANPAVPQPQIARSGRISLYVSDVDNAVRRMARVARRNAGDVFSLDVSNADRQDASAQMELRVPAAAFEAAMDGVAAIGKVRERSASAQDLTGDVTDSSARLRNLRQTESDILKIMGRSGNVSQVMDAENRLSDVRGQIETLEASLASMRGQVAYSTIDIDIQSELASQPVEPTASAQLANAWYAALHAVVQVAIACAQALLWILVFLPLVFGAVLLGVLAVTVPRRIRAPR